LDAPKEGKKENTPDSIFDIAVENSLKEVFIVDKTLTGLVSAYETAKKCNIKLRFGYRVTVCNNIDVKDNNSIRSSSKYIIFASKNNYDDLIKLHNVASTKGIYKDTPRLDFKILEELWTPNLTLGIPFYDSYYFYNLLFGYECVPSISFTKPFYFIENNSLPFDNLLASHVTSTADKDFIIPSKTIYYKNRKSFPAYMAYRCILNRTTFDKPELKHFGSKNFCMEALIEDLKN
jgi:DNA polymerase III alpha subunit